MESYKPNFDQMYWDFEDKYNNLPVDMSRSEAFSKAKADGLIDEKTFMEARRYFGKLWFYVGD